jgi:phosphatidate cytidylyltransferase
LSTTIKRSLSGLAFIVIVLGSILTHPYTYFALFLFVLIFGLIEFYKVSEKLKTKPNFYIGLVSAVLLYVYLFDTNTGNNAPYLFPLLVFSIFLAPVFELYAKGKEALVNLGLMLFGIFYIALPLSLNHYILFEPNSYDISGYNPTYIIGFLFLIWANDSFAYLVGSKMGRKKLYPSVSPNKSVEGFIGGAIGCLLFSILIAEIFTDFSKIKWAGTALIAIFCGTIGDLFESKLKRILDIKDTGNIMPGHGGILDRFDAFLFASPFFYLYIYLVR